MRSRFLVIILLFLVAVLVPVFLKPRGTPSSSSPEVPPIPAEALEALEQGRYWRASRILRGYLDSVPNPTPESILLTAEAEAGWGDWAGVERLLAGRPWLDSIGGGMGWSLLGRSRLALGQWTEGERALARYLALNPGSANRDRGITEIRRGIALGRSGNAREAGEAFRRAEKLIPQFADWIAIFAADAAATTGDTAAVRQSLDSTDPALAREWGWRMKVRAHTMARDLAGAQAAAEAAAYELRDPGRRAEAWYSTGDLRMQRGDETGAKDAFRRAMQAAPQTVAALDAARMLSQLGIATPEDHLHVGRLYLRHGNFDRGSMGLRTYLGTGKLSRLRHAEIRLELANAYFRAGKYAEAEGLALALAQEAPSKRVGAEASFLAGRAMYRQGRVAAGRAQFLRTAERFPKEQAAAEALFLVADLDHDEGKIASAKEYYRRTTKIRPTADQAGHALMRLGGLAFVEGDYVAAASIFEEYRRHHPRGRRFQQATYWAARSYQKLGDTDLARKRLAEVRAMDPVSWYGFRAAETLGESWATTPLEPSPARSAKADAAVESALVRLDLLRELELDDAADFEIERLKEHFLETDGALYALAEAFNERGYTMTGVRLGWEIHRREKAWNTRLLKIIYPFPYKDLIIAEARERGLDPFLVAGLIRQESMFDPIIKSHAGAIGLMQIMPATGEALAKTVGLTGYSTGILEQPEINLHLGTIYIAELMAQYGKRMTSVLAAYNAGPHRVSKWSAFPEYQDEELFAERIPFSETREYVKIVQQNARLYRALYQDSGTGQNTGN